MIEIDKIHKENKKIQSCSIDKESTKYDRKCTRFYKGPPPPSPSFSAGPDDSHLRQVYCMQ